MTGLTETGTGESQAKAKARRRQVNGAATALDRGGSIDTGSGRRHGVRGNLLPAWRWQTGTPKVVAKAQFPLVRMNGPSALTFLSASDAE